MFAVLQLAQTTMRSELGKMTLDKTFEERDTLNEKIVVWIFISFLSSLSNTGSLSNTVVLVCWPHLVTGHLVYILSRGSECQCLVRIFIWANDI
jgi:hypothetical protein